MAIDVWRSHNLTWISGVLWDTARSSSSLSCGGQVLPGGIRTGPGSHGLSPAARIRAGCGQLGQHQLWALDTSWQGKGTAHLSMSRDLDQAQ